MEENFRNFQKSMPLFGKRLDSLSIKYDSVEANTSCIAYLLSLMKRADERTVEEVANYYKRSYEEW